MYESNRRVFTQQACTSATASSDPDQVRRDSQGTFQNMEDSDYQVSLGIR